MSDIPADGTARDGWVTHAIGGDATAAWVTVVLPAHNSAETVDEAIASVLAQSFESFRLLIVENGSGDDTYAKCQRWADRDARVTVLHLDAPSAMAARNLGIARASSEYVAFLDADDVYLPGFLERAHLAATLHPECGTIALGGVRVNRAGRRSRLSPGLPLLRSKRLSVADAVRGGLYTIMTVARASALRDVSGFRDCDAGDDYDLWLRLLARGTRAVYIPARLVEARTQEGSRSSTRAEQSYARVVDALIDSLVNLLVLDLRPRDRRAAERRISTLRQSRTCIATRARLEERLLRGDRSHARRDYVRARPAYRVQARYLGGLLLMLLSPRLFTRLLIRRRSLGYG